MLQLLFHAMQPASLMERRTVIDAVYLITSLYAVFQFTQALYDEQPCFPAFR